MAFVYYLQFEGHDFIDDDLDPMGLTCKHCALSGTTRAIATAQGDGSMSQCPGKPAVTSKPAHKPREYPKCLTCRREVSPYLDAYYGRDAFLKRYCAKCRVNQCEVES